MTARRTGKKERKVSAEAAEMGSAKLFKAALKASLVKRGCYGKEYFKR